jgi:hypothetical protein
MLVFAIVIVEANVDLECLDSDDCHFFSLYGNGRSDIPLLLWSGGRRDMAEASARSFGRVRLVGSNTTTTNADAAAVLIGNIFESWSRSIEGETASIVGLLLLWSRRIGNGSHITTIIDIESIEKVSG